MPLAEVTARFAEFAADNDHFEFYWFPYGRNALVKRNNVFPRGLCFPRGAKPPQTPQWGDCAPPMPPAPPPPRACRPGGGTGSTR